LPQIGNPRWIYDGCTVAAIQRLRQRRRKSSATKARRRVPPKQTILPEQRTQIANSERSNASHRATRPIVPENERGLTWQKRFESLSQTRPWALLRSHSATTGDICGNQNSHHRESILHHRSNNCAPPPLATHHQRRKTALRLEAPSRIVPPMHKEEMFEIEGKWFEQIWVLQIGDFSQIRVRKFFFSFWDCSVWKLTKKMKDKFGNFTTKFQNLILKQEAYKVLRKNKLGFETF